ncbi:hypothetical protein BDV95DRAFT_641024 [Massariosphaeria phaeospora]|uniref:Uncharacterized protein n=1 Tax=Massariosphaeria phaeospora TaxID=100035 RepID=A0A7C8I6J0_9PLEO|nr:hypothetical protein BDV95DRAFT_641024 [Massariosphaeria phaeospora]
MTNASKYSYGRPGRHEKKPPDPLPDDQPLMNDQQQRLAHKAIGIGGRYSSCAKCFEAVDKDHRRNWLQCRAPCAVCPPSQPHFDVRRLVEAALGDRPSLLRGLDPSRTSRGRGESSRRGQRDERSHSPDKASKPIRERDSIHRPSAKELAFVLASTPRRGGIKPPQGVFNPFNPTASSAPARKDNDDMEIDQDSASAEVQALQRNVLSITGDMLTLRNLAQAQQNQIMALEKQNEELFNCMTIIAYNQTLPKQSLTFPLSISKAMFERVARIKNASSASTPTPHMTPLLDQSKHAGGVGPMGSSLSGEASTTQQWSIPNQQQQIPHGPPFTNPPVTNPHLQNRDVAPSPEDQQRSDAAHMAEQTAQQMAQQQQNVAPAPKQDSNIAQGPQNIAPPAQF